MKKFFLIITLMATLCFSQEPTETEETGFHKHDGFFLSLNGGGAFGSIALNMTHSFAQKMTFSGNGIETDFRIGGAPVENVILSADIITRSISGPELDIDGFKVQSNSSLAASDQTIGVGLTYYIMPANVFLSGTIGMGAFGLTFNNVTSSSQAGASFRIKAGKEWWVSKNWGLGVALAYNHVSADDKTDGAPSGYKGTLSTDKVSILFNSTFN
ncbi:MAG: hypothetical protein V1913_16565 [Fibrobacterota bacterium]